MVDGNIGEDSQDSGLLRFRQQVQDKIAVTENTAALLREDSRGSKRGYYVVTALLAFCVVAMLVMPYSFYVWLGVSFFLVCFAWLLLFLPTTRKDDRYWRTRQAIGKTEGAGRSLKYIAKKRKRLMAEVWINAFFYGNSIPAYAFVALFGISIFFASYQWLALGTMSPEFAQIVIIQCVAIIIFHGYMYSRKPYAKSMFSLPKDFKERLGEARSRSMLAMAGVLGFIFIFVVFFGFMIIVGMLKPGQTRDEIMAFIAGNGGMNAIATVLLVVIEYLVMRFFQSVTSMRMATRVVDNQLERLRSGVLAPLDAMIAQKSVDKDALEAIKAEFYQISIYRIDKHDYFGRLPTFFINPNMKLMMNRDLLAILDKAGGTG